MALWNSPYFVQPFEMESVLKINLLSLHKILCYLSCKLTSVPSSLKHQVKDNRKCALKAEV